MSIYPTTQVVFYDVDNLLWYIGVTAYKTGIKSEIISDRLITGYTENMRLLKYREGIRGDDGGCASATLNYSLWSYP